METLEPAQATRRPNAPGADGPPAVGAPGTPGAAPAASRAARVLGVLIAAHFLLAGAALLAAAGPFASALKTSPLVPAHWLVQTFADARTTAAVAGAALLLAGVLSLLGRRAVARAADGVLDDAPRLAAALGHAARTLRQESPLHLAALGAILALATGLRLVYLSQPLRYDEAYTCLIYACNHSPLFPLSAYYDPNNHVLHSLLVNLVWLGAAPFGPLPPWALRLPAFVAGVLTVPATYVWARLAFDKQAALLAAALVATSTILIEYATFARGYSLVGLFFLLLLMLAWGLKQSNNRAGWCLFAVVGALGFLTIPTMLYPFGIVVVWLLSVALRDTGADRRAVFRRLLIAVGVAALLTAELYLPLLLVSGWRRLLANGYVASLPLNGAYVQQFRANLLASWITWNRDLPGAVTWAEVVGVVVSLLAHRRITRDRVPWPAAILAWALPALLAQRVLPLARVWLFLLPVYLTLAAAGLVFLARAAWARLARGRLGPLGRPAFAAGALLLAGGLGYGVLAASSIYADNPSGRSALAVTAFLQRTLRLGDGVVAQAPDNYEILYYAWDQGTPLDPYLAWPGKYFDWRPQQRAFVVVTAGEYTLKAVLANVQFPSARFSPPRVVARYDATTIYEMDALPATP